MDAGTAPLDALTAVLERFDSYNRLGALYLEGGERPFRGWLVAGFLTPVLGWPWHRVVMGESLDIVMLDWRDRPVVYVETKTPTAALKPAHRAEMNPRLGRWGSLRHAVLTNGRMWERFDQPRAPLSEPTTRYDGARGFNDFFSPLSAARYLPAGKR